MFHLFILTEFFPHPPHNSSEFIVQSLLLLSARLTGFLQVLGSAFLPPTPTLLLPPVSLLWNRRFESPIDLYRKFCLSFSFCPCNSTFWSEHPNTRSGLRGNGSERISWAAKREGGWVRCFHDTQRNPLEYIVLVLLRDELTFMDRGCRNSII